MEVLFSSPAGVLYFKIHCFLQCLFFVGFRPLLGFFISKYAYRDVKVMIAQFSSPAGVLYFKIESPDSVYTETYGFSSPAGVLYFKILF